MGLFSKPTKWIKRQTHGGLKKGLSASGIKSTLKGAAKNPLTYAAGAMLIPGVAPAIMSGLGKVGGLAKAGGIGAAKKVGGLFSGGGDIGLDGGDIASAAEPGRFRSIVSGAGKFLGGKDGFDMQDALSIGKAAGSAYGAYDAGQRANRLENIATEEYNAGAPLRAAARQMLLDDSQPNHASLFASEPQARYRKVQIGSRV